MKFGMGRRKNIAQKNREGEKEEEVVPEALESEFAPIWKGVIHMSHGHGLTYLNTLCWQAGRETPTIWGTV